MACNLVRILKLVWQIHIAFLTSRSNREILTYCLFTATGLASVFICNLIAKMSAWKLLVMSGNISAVRRMKVQLSLLLRIPFLIYAVGPQHLNARQFIILKYDGKCLQRRHEFAKQDLNYFLFSKIAVNIFVRERLRAAALRHLAGRWVWHLALKFSFQDTCWQLDSLCQEIQ